MKTFNWSILLGLLAAACTFAQQMCDPDDRYYETPPTRYEGQGVAGAVSPAWLVDNAGWSYATPERIAAEDAAAAAAAEVEYAEKDAALAEQASLFREVLRAYFGEGAETNTAITAKVVEQYFVSKQRNGTIIASDLGAATLLERGFSVLKDFTGDGTSWSFPWHLIPEVAE